MSFTTTATPSKDPGKSGTTRMSLIGSGGKERELSTIEEETEHRQTSGLFGISREFSMDKLWEEYEEETEMEVSTAIQVNSLASKPTLARTEVVELASRDETGKVHYKVERDMLRRIERTVEELQDYLRRMSALVPYRRSFFVVDPDNLILSVLKDAESIGQMHAAWIALTRRLSAAQNFMKKYKSEYLRDGLVNSPVSTNAELHEEIKGKGTVDEKLRMLHSLVPRHNESFSAQVTSRIAHGDPWNEVLAIPAWLNFSATQGLPEDSSPAARTSYKSGPQFALPSAEASKGNKASTPRQQMANSNNSRRTLGNKLTNPYGATATPYKSSANFFDNSVSTPLATSTPHSVTQPSSFNDETRANVEPNSLYGLAAPTSALNFGGFAPNRSAFSAEVRASNPWAEPASYNQRDQSEIEVEKALLHNEEGKPNGAVPSFSSNREFAQEREESEEQGSYTAGSPGDPSGGPPSGPPSDRPHDSYHSRSPPSMNDRGSENPFLPAGPSGPPGPPGPPSPPGPPGPPGPFGGNTNGPSNDPDAPVAPYGNFVPTIKAELKTDDLPSWDGNHDTAIDYFWKINQFSALGGHLPKALGFWLWKGLKEKSPIQMWFVSQPPLEQIEMRRHYLKFLKAIKEQYLDKKWQIRMISQFENQQFRQTGHENESPIEFLTRRIMYTRMLAKGDQGGPLEVYIIMEKAPLSWHTVIAFDSIQSTSQLFTKITEHDKALVQASKLDHHQVLTSDNLAYNLRKLGISIDRDAVKRSQDSRRSYGPKVGMNTEVQLPEDDSEALGGEDGMVIASVYQTLKQRQRPPPKGGYPYPKNDHVVTKLNRPPPSPCKVCGSSKHWDRECPDWAAYLERAKRQVHFAALDDESGTEDMYSTAFSILLKSNVDEHFRTESEDGLSEQGFDEAVRDMSEKKEALLTERKTTSWRTTIEEVFEEDSERSHKGTPKGDHILEEVGEVNVEQEEDRGGYIASTHDPPEDLTTPPPPGFITLTRKRSPASGQSAMGISVVSVRGRLVSTGNPLVDLRLDSCADISLVSEEYLKGLKNAPKILQGSKLRLWQVADKNCTLKGYVHLHTGVASSNKSRSV